MPLLFLPLLLKNTAGLPMGRRMARPGLAQPPLCVRSVLVYSEVGWHVPFARKGTRKIALTGMLRSDESVTLGG